MSGNKRKTNMEKNNGGPAFPVSTDDFRDLNNHPMKGMSLRDYFAAKAMEGLLAHGVDFGLYDKSDPEATHENRLAKLSYNYADAMLKARGA